jgi:hypothetical protein
MTTRQPLASLLLVATVLLAGCLAPVQSFESAGDGPQPAVRTIGAANATHVSVTGSGTISAEADLALVRVSVTALADSADEARQQVAADADRMTAALRDAGVDDDAVTTLSYRIAPEYDASPDGRELVGYRAIHAFSVEVAPADAGRVVDLAVGNGADTVDGVAFTLTDETRADLREQALAQAVERARADADAVAAAADLSITEVHRVDVGGDYVPYGTAVREVTGGDAGAGTVIEPGPVTVRASVSVTYVAE